jgi:hypothetical protein
VILFEVLSEISNKEHDDERNTQYRTARVGGRAIVSGQSGPAAADGSDLRRGFEVGRRGRGLRRRVRQFGRAWAKTDPLKRRFVDALTITVMGTRVGRWPIDLLTSPDHEIVSRVAILTERISAPVKNLPRPRGWQAGMRTSCGASLAHPRSSPLSRRGMWRP